MTTAALVNPLIDPTTTRRCGFSWWRPGLVQLALGMLAFLVLGQVDAADWWVPGGFLAASGVALLPPIYRALNRPTTVVLADHMLVLAIAFLVYFVVGAMLLPFGPEDQAEFSLAYYRINASGAMSVAAVNAFGFGLALIASVLSPKRVFARIAHSAVRVGKGIPIEWVIAGFFAFGSYAYVYVWNFDANPRADVVISGSWRSLSNLLLVAIVLAAAHQGRAAKALRVLAVFTAIAMAGGGLLLLNKGQVLTPIMALCMGYIWRLGVRKVALPGLAVLLLTFLVVANPVATVRNLYGANSAMDLDSRILAVGDAIFRPKTDAIGSEYHPWARFCYTPSQAAAMDLFDAGRGGGDFDNAAWVLVPRFLFPQKPVITATGQEFHYKLTGNLNSSTGQGVFVNGYYNLGIGGVVVSGLSVGLMLAWTSAFAGVVFKRNALIWLPFALLGSYMAFRIDGFFIGDFLGPFSLLLYALILSALASQSINRRSCRSC